MEPVKKPGKPTKLSEFLLLNPYEKIAPFNLWFEHPEYRVEDYKYASDKSMRIRYFGDSMLSLYPNIRHDNLKHMESFMDSMTVYQPFYPESFYSIWEFLSKELVKPSRCLVISQEPGIGAMEAVKLYQTRNDFEVMERYYHVWLAGGESRECDIGYISIKECFPYLSMNNPITYLRSTQELQTYNMIFVNNISLFNVNHQWESYKKDFAGTLFYVIEAMTYLDAGGSLMIRITLDHHEHWLFLFNLIGDFFREYDIFRPTTSHPHNPEAYLFLTGFYRPEIFPSYLMYVKVLCEHKYYLAFIQLIDKKDSTGIGKKHLIAMKSYQKQMEMSVPVKDCQMIDEFLVKQGLMQIKELCSPTPNVFTKTTVKYSRITPIRPFPPDDLYQDQYYRKLLYATADLNVTKEVMNNIKTSAIRGSLDDFVTYGQLTSELDMSFVLKNTISRQYGSEMVTVAWMKLYEILSNYPELLPVEEGKTVRTFNVCDAPGAFVSAINQYVTTRGGNLDWYAQSLNPSHTVNQGKGFEDIYGLIRCHPDRWIFGEDNTGDITHAINLRGYRDDPRVKDVDFMTGDAGIEIKGKDYNIQENLLLKINMGQILAVLSCLRKGGSAVVKTFLPLVCSLSVSLIYLLSSVFRRVDIVKPTTSHAINSEVYLVMYNYQKIEPDELELLYNILEDPNITCHSMLFERIKPDFIESYAKAVVQLIDRQISFVEVLYCIYYTGQHIDQNIDEWFEKNPIKPLTKHLLHCRSQKAATRKIDIDQVFD
jgi:23S rRNA U2552 (ribose-2'-O)-methylase RlmE/FtsJ